MAIVKQTQTYALDGTKFSSLAVWEDEGEGARPGVVLVPTFMGRTDGEDGHAERLAELGYVVLSMDLYGSDARPADFEQAKAAMEALTEDRTRLAARVQAGVEALSALDTVEPGQIAVLGFCLGGKCALDFARTGAEVAGVVSFHGVYDAPDHDTAETIRAKVLVLHGWDDPIGPPEAVLALTRELDAKGATWELDAYSGTGHGFTNPKRPDMYRELADARSWARCEDFLMELFV